MGAVRQVLRIQGASQKNGSGFLGPQLVTLGSHAWAEAAARSLQLFAEAAAHSLQLFPPEWRTVANMVGSATRTSVERACCVRSWKARLSRRLSDGELPTGSYFFRSMFTKVRTEDTAEALCVQICGARSSDTGGRARTSAGARATGSTGPQPNKPTAR